MGSVVSSAGDPLVVLVALLALGTSFPSPSPPSNRSHQGMPCTTPTGRHTLSPAPEFVGFAHLLEGLHGQVHSVLLTGGHQVQLELLNLCRQLLDHSGLADLLVQLRPVADVLGPAQGCWRQQQVQ